MCMDGSYNVGQCISEIAQQWVQTNQPILSPGSHDDRSSLQMFPTWLVLTLTTCICMWEFQNED